MAARGPASQTTTDTVIIGASAAGLATAACLKRRGLPFVVLEKGSRVASPWERHYDRLHLHSSRAMSGLPHRPLSRRLGRYPAREDVLAYFEDYAAHFGISPRFSQAARRISRAGDGWQVETDEGSHRARNVVVAAGMTHEPHTPSWPGLTTFAGPVLHSSAYRNARAFAGQSVLVVGIGNSGAEIALDLCEGGAKAAIAVRSPVNVVPREFLGIPIDVWALMLDVFPAFVGNAVGRSVSWLKYGRLQRFGLRPLPFGPVTGFREHGVVPILDIGTMARIRSGDIAIVPAPASFTSGQVRFTDGSERAFDAVVLATGYRPAVASLLDADARAAVDAEGTPLASGAAVLPGLYFCGYHVSLTGMLRRIGRDARAIAGSIASR